MSDTDRIMLSAQVSTGSALHEEFDEYREEKGFESKSEAVRAAVRDGIEANREQEAAGPWSALSVVAGDELSLQLRLVGWFMTFTAVAIWAFETGLLGGYVWAAGAVVFGFLTFTTVIGAAVGLAEVLNPAGVASSSSAPDTDEVDA